MVECAICLEEFKHPRSLPCQHSFCTECLQGVLGKGRKIHCPCCNKKTPVPNGVRELPVDFRANSWLEIMSEYHKAKAAREAEYAAEAVNSTASVDVNVVSEMRQSGGHVGNCAPDTSSQQHHPDATSENPPLYQTLLELLSGRPHEPPSSSPNQNTANMSQSLRPEPSAPPGLFFDDPCTDPTQPLAPSLAPAVSQKREQGAGSPALAVVQYNAPIESFSQMLAMLEDLTTGPSAPQGLEAQNTHHSNIQPSTPGFNTPPPLPPHNIPPVSSRRLPALPPMSSHGQTQIPRLPQGQSQVPRLSQGQSQAPRSFILSQERPPTPPRSPRRNLFSGHSPPPIPHTSRPSQLECEIPPPPPKSLRPSQRLLTSPNFQQTLTECHDPPLVPKSPRPLQQGHPKHSPPAGALQASITNSEKAPPLPSTPRPSSLEHQMPPLPRKSIRFSERGHENLQSSQSVLYPPNLPSSLTEDAPPLPRSPRPTQLHSLHIQTEPPVGPVFPPSTDETSPPPKMFRSSLQPKPEFEWV